MQRSINIKPSPRILKVLGDIEFESWQCLAELVDNGFDEFQEMRRAGVDSPDKFQVSITLPTGGLSQDSEIIVTDTGRGMDLETMNNAVRAGWSSNDQFSKLGLFGMGFNVATARLGRVSQVLTTRRGDTEWIGVTIDIEAMRDDFEAPVITKQKSSNSIQGTIVKVSRLDTKRVAWLTRNQAVIRNILGDVYSHLLSNERLDLLVNGVAVKPRRPCPWGEARSVTFGTGVRAEEIGAYIAIDHPYPPGATCLQCRNWQSPGLDVCSECGGSDLVRRSRRIHGWLGIQRYLHKTEFGIDFFRNGRKILRRDKRLFQWQNPNDPIAAVDVEYPIELGQGGRIIGEIHLDHVPVHYQKNAFDWSDRSWLAAAEFLRGQGPLLPRRAKATGFPENDSPLGRLHRGFRRNDPGYRYLIPGDGARPIHDQTREWGRKFDDGDPEFQTDEKWWAAVVFHEERRAAGPVTQRPASREGSAIARLGLDSETGGENSPDDALDSVSPQSAAKSAETTAVETELERLDRYKGTSRLVPALTGEYGLLELGAAVSLQTYELDEGPVVNNDNERTPVWLAREPGNSYAAIVDRSHPVFRDFADDPLDLVLVSLADHLKTRAEHRMPLAQVVALLKERHFTDRKINLRTSAAEAMEMLRDVRERMAEAIAENPDRAWQFLNPDERTTIESNLVNEGAEITLQQAHDSGGFLLYCPAMFLPRLVEEWPEAFLDGHVFLAPYESLISSSTKRLSAAKVIGYLYDAARLSTVDSMLPLELVRARYSVDLLLSELAPESGPTNG